MSWYVYILRCGDETLYTGITDDIPRRLAAHRAGKGAKYTRGRGPLELVWQEEVPDKSAALKREIAIKRLTRQEKERLIERAQKPPLERRCPSAHTGAEDCILAKPKCAKHKHDRW